MLHLIKLAVGIRDLDHLRAMQSARLQAEPPLRHRTRNQPRRAAEILDGGSIYWVVSRATLARQRILDIRPDCWDDGAACAGLILDPELVQVQGRPMKPFQGWRYLTGSDAPADLDPRMMAEGADALPAKLRQELQAFCLL
jgi:hypothetical protein